jgi:hypothetical protein
MVRSILKKVAWVGRGASMVFGLALVLALLFGMASMAFARDGQSFILGERNVAQSLSTLVRQGAGPALSLQVDSGPPLAVNSSSKVSKLNADQVDGKNSSAFMPSPTYVVNEVVVMGSDTTGTVRVVFCDKGDMAISSDSSGLGTETKINTSYRNEYVGRLTWWVSASKPVGPEDTWTAQVVCADFGEIHQ